jgi:S-adenosylmethionine synthetase
LRPRHLGKLAKKGIVMTRTHLFTSEAVSGGHPDKLADQISDAVLDAFLARDPDARVACETLLADQFVVVAGEFKTARREDFLAVQDQAEALARRVLREVGYTDAASGIDPDTCEVQVRFNHQSSHINQGVDRADGEIGAGDQGLMFGYATDETPDLMPYPFWLATQLVKQQAQVRKSGELPWLRPDAKSQVTLRYENGIATGIEKLVLSTQHAPEISTEELRRAVMEHIVRPILPVGLDTSRMTVLINPTGRFEIGGPNGDTGLTGRKIVADTYGGACPHGGGAFSGKDPSKVDRSAAYMARYIAKNVVAAGLARRCTVQLAYAIGVAEPMSLYIDLHGTGQVDEERLEDAIHQVFRLTPKGIIESLDLKRPIYRQTSTYGHFGRTDPDFTWERMDKVNALLSCLN